MNSSRYPAALLIAGTCVALSLAPAARAAVLMSTTTLTGQITSTGTGPQANYGKTYNGEYTISAAYTIVTMPDGMGGAVVDPTKSFVTFTDTTKKFGPFDTIAIPITDATGDLVGGDITGFSFSATDWYKNLPRPLIQNGISGSVDIIAGTGTMTASYKNVPRDPTKTTVLNYAFVSPVPPAAAPAPGGFEPFPGVPEPGAWAMMILGAALTGGAARRRRAQACFA